MAHDEQEPKQRAEPLGRAPLPRARAAHPTPRLPGATQRTELPTLVVEPEQERSAAAREQERVAAERDQQRLAAERVDPRAATLPGGWAADAHGEPLGDGRALDGSAPGEAHAPSDRAAGEERAAGARSSASQPSACAPGSSVDHFEIIRLIGRGGMGEVYLAYDTQLGRRVALKMITVEALGSENAVDRFLFEVRTTAQFSHPNIVTVYAAGRHRGRPYVALEYLRGQNLRERMEERPPGLQESLRIVLAVVEALEEAHRHGILHRDLKPENVVIPLDGRLRVVDFGLAKRVRGAEAGLLAGLGALGTSSTGTLLSPTEAAGADALAPAGKGPRSVRGLKGTPAYMAPEQWLDVECGPFTDVWAVGNILFELCAGRLPFEYDDLRQQLTAVCGPAPSPRLGSHVRVPAELDELVARCLDKDPQKRPTAAELAAALRDMLLDNTAAATGRESPFRGLLPFTERHAALFFGREAEIAAFVERVRLHPVLPVVGPSGAGKSSFVQAGIIPRLREQEPWTVIALRPGGRPFQALAARLADVAAGPATAPLAPSRASLEVPAPAPLVSLRPPPTSDVVGQLDDAAVARLANQLGTAPRRLSLELRAIADRRGSKVLLYVDQLEELFTLVGDEATRARFIQALCTAAEDPLDPVRVVLSVRDDYLGRLATGPEAREALTHVTVIQSLDRAALEQTVLRPVAAAGCRFDDPTVVSDMVASVAGGASGLPLLQFAAQMLWDRRDVERRLLLRSAYEAIGGVEGALARHADGVLDGLSPSEQLVARELLLRLVTAERTRKVASRAQVLQGLEAAGEVDTRTAERVLGRLTEARLLSVSKVRGGADEDATIELAHESLIHHWSTLSRWIAESREELAFLAEIGQAAELWAKRGRRPDELWRASALAEALRTAERCTTQPPATVLEFLAAARDREQRRLRNRRWATLSTIGLSAAVAVVAVLVALLVSRKEQEARVQRDRAEERQALAVRRQAEALREGARAALGDEQLLEARAKLRLSLETESEASTAARGLWWQLDRNPLWWSRPFGGSIYAVAFSPDGNTVAAACQDRAVYLVDAQTSAVRALRGHADQVMALAYSPNGKLLASASWSGEIRLWNAADGTVTRVLQDHRAGVAALGFSPDGAALASGNLGREIRIYEEATGKQLRVLASPDAGANEVRFSPDGRSLVSAHTDGAVRVWEAGSGRLLRTCAGHSAAALALDLSPDGAIVAVSAVDATIRLLRTASCELVRVEQGHTAAIHGVRFSPDGALLASASADGTMRLWDARSGAAHGVYGGYGRAVWDVSFSPDGRLVATGDQLALRLWRTSAGPQSARLGGHASATGSVAFSDDGRTIASGGVDQTIRLWDATTGVPLRVLTGHTGAVSAVDFSKGGGMLVSGSEDRTVRIWEPATGKQAFLLAGHAATVKDVRIAPDGRTVASASFDRTLRTWDGRSGKAGAVIQGHAGGVTSVDFSPDGRAIASAGLDKTVRLWDPSSGRQTALLAGHTEQVWGVRFGPGGDWLASCGSDGSVRRWDPRAKTATVVAEHPGRAYAVAVPADGAWIGSTGAHGSAGLWPLRGGAPIVLRGHREDVNAIAFSPDGKLVATAGDDATVRTWHADTGRAFWRAPIMLGTPPWLLTHLGWKPIAASALGSAAPAAPAGVPPELGSALRAALESGARYGEQVGAELVCLWTYDDAVELWDARADTRLGRHAIADIEQLVGLPSGCAVRAAGRVVVVARDGAPRELAAGSGVAAISSSDGELLVATAGEVRVVTDAGESRAAFPASPGLMTAVAGRHVSAGHATAPDAPFLAVGYRDGNIELLSIAGDQRGPLLSFEDVPASPPVTMRPGPMSTIIVGYANGVLGVWNLLDGARLAAAQLHGPVVHVRVAGSSLYAATELGDHLVWDLGAFHLTDCELLKQIWDAVPVTWENGRPARRPPPAEHRCASKPSR